MKSGKLRLLSGKHADKKRSKSGPSVSQLSVIAIILAINVLAAAQTPSADINGPTDTGYPANAIIHGTHIENVRINNGNLHIEIPIISLAGRGETVVYRYVYDSKGWEFRADPSVPPPQGPVGSIVPAVTQQFRYLAAAAYVVTYTNLGMIQCGTTDPGGIPIYYTNFGAYTLVEADGTKHPFPGTYPLSITGCPTTRPGTTLHSDDGSGWILHIGFTNSDLFPVNAIGRDGTVVNFLQDGSGEESDAVDRNGNILSGTTDTLGRSMPSPNGSYYDSTGKLQSVSMTTVKVPVQTALCTFYGLGSEKCKESTISLTQPSIITLPDGLTYQFTYAQNGYGEPTSMILPTGAQISWTWGNLDSGGPKVTSRTVTVGGQSYSWNYNYGFPANNLPPSGTWINSMVDPLGNETDYTCKYIFVGSQGSGLLGDPGCTPTIVQYYQGRAKGGTLIKTVATSYLTDGAILPTSVTTTWNQANLVSKVETDWDSNNTFRWSNPTERREFDYTGSLVRRTDYSYLHLTNQTYQNLNLAEFPTTVTVYDGSANMVAQRKTGYDESTVTSTSKTPAPSHDYTNFGSGNSIRANATSVSAWRNTDGVFIKTSHTYDDLGNLRSTTDPNGNITNLSYNDDWASSPNNGCVPAGVNTQAFVTQVTNALQHNLQTAYYPCTSFVQARLDQNDINAKRPGTTFTYDLMNRPLTINYPDGGQTSVDYHGDALPLKSTKSVLLTSKTSLATSTTRDGLGRASQTSVDSAPGGPDLVDITYDALGRTSTMSNPHTANSASTDGVTTYQYDALGRTTQVTEQDGSIKLTAYEQPAAVSANTDCTLASDEAGKQLYACSDALGRLLEADEVGDLFFGGTPGTGSVTISGNEQSQSGIGGHPGTPGTATVSFSSSIIGASTQCLPDNSVCDQGYIYLTVNGSGASTFWPNGSFIGYPVQYLANTLNQSNPYVTASFNGNLNGPAITVTAKTVGANTNFSLSASSSSSYDGQSCTDSSGNVYSPCFPTPFITVSPSGPTLTGGADAYGGSTVYDSGTCSVTISGTAYSASFGQGATTSSIATALASAISAGNLASASASGATISLTAKISGTTSDYSVGGGNCSYNSSAFSGPSFVVNPPVSGKLTGGTNSTRNLVTLYNYDTLGNLICVEQHGNATTGTGCAAPSSSDASSPWRVRRFTYDSLSRLLTAKNPESGTIGYGYDADGNLLAKTDARGITTSYSYDALNRLTLKSYSDGSTGRNFYYDVTPPFQYNAPNHGSSIGRLTHASNNVTAAYDPTYDAMGRVIGMRYCILSDCNYDLNATATYDLGGGLTQLTYPDGETVTYTPDAAGRMLSAVDTANSFNYVTGATYGADGSITGFISGNTGSFAGISNSFSYNKRLQTCRITASTGTLPVSCTDTANTGNVLDLGYNFSLGNGDNGNVLGMTNYKDTTRNQTFTYDALNRLISAQNGGTDCTQATVNGKTKYWGNNYGYDAWGNLLQKTVTKCSAENLSVIALANNQLTGYGYDAAGNMTSDPTDGVTSTFDAESQMATVTKNSVTTTYSYDPDGNRARKVVPGSPTTEYVYFNGQIVAEKNALTGAWTNYVFFNGERVARRDPGNTVSYYFSDHLKTTDIVTDAQGNIKSESDIYPWGGELQFANNDSNHYKFTGKERDSESGLDYFGARYYSNGLGRFITPDWDANAVAVPYADVDDPQTLNLYSYVRNEPSNKDDLDGHGFWKWLWNCIKGNKDCKSDEQIEDDYQKAKAKWEAEHPGRSYDAYTFERMKRNLFLSLDFSPMGELSIGGEALEGALKAGRTVETVVEIVEQEGKTVHILIKGAKGDIEVVAEMTKEGDKLVLRGTHVQGQGAGTSSLSELKAAARKLGKAQGVKEVVVEGGTRTSGANVGKTPIAITIKVGE